MIVSSRLTREAQGLVERILSAAENGGAMQWTITELLSKGELKTEGRSLRHCVSSYAGKCKEGQISIWSLQVKNGLGETIRLVTIALQPRTRNITQVRSRHNLRPVFSARVEEKFGWYLRRSKDMLRSWVHQEGLGQRGSDLSAWVGR